ncbi:Transcription factor, MADS-box [Corchorus capsularis]|uniref:Transcription factor, MADS-box n=1 Tax=Corchorus capsularis TaxID=210143 RepID=A0A1R3GG17_COCAP|nr:Transcription factor, MADS-box [Corchorus capsularis]
MGRGKLRLELVENEKTRAATFKKRIIGLKKKAEELTILCNVRICMVIFGPKLKDKPLKVDVWPSDRAQVKSMIHDCKTSTSQKRIFTMSDYLNLRQKKVEDEIAQVRRANFKARFPTWDVRIDNLSSDQLELLRSELDSKLEAAKIKLTAMKGIDQNHHHQAPHPQYTSDHLISAANFPPKNLSDNYLQSHNFPLKTPSPFDHQIQAIPQNSLDYGLFMGQHSGNQVQSNHLPMKINLNPFDHHNIYGFPQKNLDYNGLIMGQQSGNFVQSHHVPLKTTRNQFDHIQSFPHNKNYGLFMDPQPPQAAGTCQILWATLLWAHLLVVTTMIIKDFQLLIIMIQCIIPCKTMMFKQLPKPYDAWFPPPSMQPDHQASNFDQLLYSESDPRLRSEFLGDFYRNMNHEDHDLANRAFKKQRL